MTPPKGNNKINHLGLSKIFYLTAYTLSSYLSQNFLKFHTFMHLIVLLVEFIYSINIIDYQLNAQMKKGVKIIRLKSLPLKIVYDFSVF